MDFGRLSAGRGSNIPQSLMGRGSRIPPNVYVYLYIHGRGRWSAGEGSVPQIVSNIDGARVSYPPKLCPLIMGRGCRIPPTFGFFHTVWVQYPGVGEWVPSLPIDGARVTYPPTQAILCPIIDGARVSYPPNVELLHRVGLVSR